MVMIVDSSYASGVPYRPRHTSLARQFHDFLKKTVSAPICTSIAVKTMEQEVLIDEAVTRPEPQTLSVLLVEDDQDEAYFLKTLIEAVPEMDIQITWASTRGIAFHKMRQQPFDLVLLDLNLTDSFGSSTFYCFLLEAPETPIIVLTGMDDQGLASTLLRDGAKSYLRKFETTTEILALAIRLAVQRASDSLDYLV